MASTYGIIGRVGVLVEPTFKGVQEKVRDGLGDPLSKQAPKQGRNVGDMIVKGTTKAFKWGGLAAGAALGTAITKGFGRLRAMEDATAKIEGLGYAASEVDQIMGDVQGALDGTMFLYSEGANVAAGALAAGVEQGEELESYLRLTADAATQAGIDFNSMGQMMNRVNSSGKLTGDVLNQLEENGVYVGAAIAESLGVTQEEFRKMVSQGEVSADVFTQVMEEQFAGSSENAAETMTGAMSLAWTAVGQLGERLIAEVYPYLRDFFQGFYDWVQEISPAVEDFGKRVGEALGNIIGWITENPGAVKAFAQAIGAVFAAMAAYTIVTKVTDAFKGLNIVMSLNPVGAWVAGIVLLVGALVWAWNNVDWFRDAVVTAWDWITTAFTWAWESVISPVIDAIVGAWHWLVGAFTTAWNDYLYPVFAGIASAAQWLWNDILSPVFAWIGDAWGNLMNWFQDTWNNILKPVWDAVASVAQWLWTAVLFVVFTAIWTAWQVLSTVIKAYWDTVLKPVWNAVATVAQWLWNSVLKPVFGWIQAGWQLLLTAIQWAWNNILKPVWDAVATVALWLWNNVLSNVFTWIGNAWQLLLLGIQLYWNNVLKPVWNAVATVAQWLWNNVLKPVFGYIASQWRTTIDNMKWAWDNVLKPTWDRLVSIARWLWDSVLSPIFGWIGDKWDRILRGMKRVWENVLKPAFDKFGDAVQNLRDKFETAVDNIKKAWDNIKRIAAKPINFVIDKVINEGLIDGFNKLTSWIPGVNELSPISAPESISKYGYAAGGYTGDGARLEPAGVVHKGEFVLQKKATSKLMRTVGLSGLYHMNEHGEFPGYSGGGLVRPVNGRFTSGFGASRGRWPHAGVDWAVPVGTPVKAALAGSVARAGWNIVTGRTGIGVLLSHPGNRNTYYGHLSRLGVRVGDDVRKGQGIGLSGNTGRSTGPHLHFETWTGGQPVDPMKYMGGLPASDSGGEGGGFDPLAPFRAIGEKITGWVKDKFPDGGIMVDAGIGAAKHGFDSILEWAADKVGAIGDFFTGGDSDGGSGPVRDQVKDVAARFGWNTGAQWSALSRLIQKESSWNPNAANPVSTARGLFQKMTSIHGPVESTAAGQAEWGLKYIRDRYGSPMSAMMHHNRHNWYHTGGLVDDPSVLFRDRGGNLPPGLSMVLNNTGRDETILPDTPQNIESAFLRQGNAGVTINGDVWAHSPEQVAQEIHKEARRKRAVALPV